MKSEELKDNIKALLEENGLTWLDIAKTRNEKNANNLHNKFKNGTIRFNEVQDILSNVDYELQITRKFNKK